MSETSIPNTTPELNVRKMKFDFSDEIPRYWNHDSPALTHYFTALSLFFPDGEQFFIDSVRLYQDRIHDPKLRDAMEDFARQEAQHGIQHRRYNKWVSRNEAGLENYERAIKRVLDFTQRVSPHRFQLSMTIALEHFTAVLADRLLSEPRYSEGVHPAIKSLWLWHAAEEIEHKAVAFDVYQECEGSYWARVLVMARIMWGFPMAVHFVQLSLLLNDRKRRKRSGDRAADAAEPAITLRDFAYSIRFIWGKGGFMRTIWPELKAYYRRDFHPWQTDNRDLVEARTPDFAVYEIKPADRKPSPFFSRVAPQPRP